MIGALIGLALFFLAVTVTWYAARNLIAAVQTAAIGVNDRASLIFGTVLLWIGGGIALFVGGAVHEPARYPGSGLGILWTIVVFAVAAAIRIYRGVHIAAPTRRRTRDDVDQRIIAALAAAVVIGIILVLHAL